MRQVTRLRRIRDAVVILNGYGFDVEERRPIIEDFGEAGFFGVRGYVRRPLQQYMVDLAERFLAGETVVAIAADLALPRDVAYRHISAGLKRRGLTFTEINRQREKDAQSARLLHELLVRCSSAKPCVVCGAWVLRGDYVTCSPECAARQQTSRRFWNSEDRHEQHRIHQARSILKRPERYQGTSRWVWAQRMLSDDPPPPNRRYVTSNNRDEAALLAPHLVTSVAPQEVLDRYNAGESAASISRSLGYKRDRILRWLRDAGVTIRPPGGDTRNCPDESP